MQDELLLRAWNAHRDYIQSVRAGVALASTPRPRRPQNWLERLLGINRGSSRLA